MSKYLDINALTDEVLAFVEEAEQSTKTASDQNEEVRTEIGKAIKEAAANIREHSGTEVTTEDLNAIVKAAKEKLAFMEGGGTAGGALAGAGTGALAGGAMLGPVGALGGAATGGITGGALGNSAGGAAGTAAQGVGHGIADVTEGIGEGLGKVSKGTGNALAGEQNQFAQQPQQPQQQQVQNPAAPTAKTGSDVGNQLRKVASEIRQQGAANEEIKLTKAAKMLTAAVGLTHLTEDIK